MIEFSAATEFWSPGVGSRPAPIRSSGAAADAIAAPHRSARMVPMSQSAKVGLIVLGVIALGIFLADQTARTPHRQFDPWFILIMVVVGIIFVLATPTGGKNGPH